MDFFGNLQKVFTGCTSTTDLWNKFPFRQMAQQRDSRGVNPQLYHNTMLNQLVWMTTRSSITKYVMIQFSFNSLRKFATDMMQYHMLM